VGRPRWRLPADSREALLARVPVRNQ